MKKVYFIQRTFAYLIDYVIVYFVLLLCVSAVGLFVPTSEKETKAYEEFMNSYTEILENPGNNSLDTFYSKQMDNIYIIEKGNVPVLLFGIIINVGYFGAFQYLNNGQTLGKKAVKIRVNRNDSKHRYTYLSSAIRAALTYSSFTNLLLCLVFLIFNNKSFVIPYGIISIAAFVFNVVTLIMIAFRKDGRGLPDMICHTRVENVVKES